MKKVFKNKMNGGFAVRRNTLGLFESVPDWSEIGSIDYSIDFDEDEYNEWLEDNGAEASDESLRRFYEDSVYFNIEFFDSVYEHHLSFEYFSYDEICDEFTEEIADKILKDCIKKGKGSLVLSEYIAEDIDVHDPDQLNREAVKLLPHGGYFKGCRGFILSDGVIVYTELEHNTCSVINGVGGTGDFIDLGNIRIMPNSIDMAKLPTYKQEMVLIKLISSYSRDSLYVDCYDGGRRFSHEYVNPYFQTVMNDIYDFYGVNFD